MVDRAPRELAGQAKQAREPGAAANDAAGQGVHTLIPTPPANRPAGHGVHVARAPSAKVPTGQAWQAPLPVAENRPGAQGVQTEEPAVSATVPGAQGKQRPGPWAFLKVPMGQLSQLVCFSRTWNLPTGHLWQPKALVPGENQPCSQSMHRNAPEAAWAVPAPHGVQPTAPLIAKRPAGQTAHEV